MIRSIAINNVNDIASRGRSGSIGISGGFKECIIGIAGSNGGIKCGSYPTDEGHVLNRHSRLVRNGPINNEIVHEVIVALTAVLQNHLISIIEIAQYYGSGGRDCCVYFVVGEALFGRTDGAGDCVSADAKDG